MPTLAPRQPPAFTYDEYRLLPEDGRRYELIEGDILVSPSPTTRHQTVSRRLQYALMQALEVPGLAQIFDAPTDLILDNETVVQPDLIVVSAARFHQISERGIEGTPDLTVEILSPTSGDRDKQLKRRVYEKFGIHEYWVVDPVYGFITAWSLRDGRYQQRAYLDRTSTLTWPAFDQVRIDLAAIFKTP